MQAYGSVSVTEVGQLLGCGAREGEAETDNREMMDLSDSKWRPRAMKTSSANMKQQSPEPAQV